MLTNFFPEMQTSFEFTASVTIHLKIITNFMFPTQSILIILFILSPILQLFNHGLLLFFNKFASKSNYWLYDILNIDNNLTK